MLAPDRARGGPGEAILVMARVRGLCRRSLLPVALLASLPAPVAWAAGEIDTRRFPKIVRLLLVPEETSLLKELRDEKDRVEFQRIFWARRDPSPGTLANEFEESVRAAWARADELFAVPGQRGSETGCGQILALLGRPQEMKGLEVRMEYDVRDTRDGAADPRSGPSAALRRGRHLHGAELRLSFDADCRFPKAASFSRTPSRGGFARRSTRHRLQPWPDGHLVPAAAQLGGGAGALEPVVDGAVRLPARGRDEARHARDAGRGLVAGLAASLSGHPARRRPARLAGRSGADASGQALVSVAWVASWPRSRTAPPWLPGLIPEGGRHQ